MVQNKQLYLTPECTELLLEPRNLVCQSPDVFAITALGDYNDVTDDITLIWE